jgi:hypothetical protein
MLGQSLLKLVYHSVRLKVKVDEESAVIDLKTLSFLKEISDKFEMDFLIRFWELMQKYINEINNYFDEKQCFEMIIMRLCYVSIIPTPFELINKEHKKKLKNEDTELRITERDLNKSTLKSQSNNKYQKSVTNNLALNSDVIRHSQPVIKQSIDQLLKFKSLVQEIEKKSEMLISYHLKNSFRLVRLEKNENITEIELQNISDNSDAKKILWKASSLLNKITNDRWMISLSTKKGLKTLVEFESEIEKEKIEKIKKNTFVKKILEIIPLSEVVSVKEIDKS